MESETSILRNYWHRVDQHPGVLVRIGDLNLRFNSDGCLVFCAMADHQSPDFKMKLASYHANEKEVRLTFELGKDDPHSVKLTNADEWHRLCGFAPEQTESGSLDDNPSI